MTELKWYELAEFDDFLTSSVVDSVHYWATIRKAYPESNLLPAELLTTKETLSLIRNHLVFPTGKEAGLPPNQRLSCLISKFLENPKVRRFLTRYSSASRVTEFARHARRYFLMYQQDCGYEIGTTDRYLSRSGKLEACIVTRRMYEKNEEIKFLSGALAQLNEEEVNLDQNDFSIINISSRSLPCLMLGPTRFVNHDCNGNAKFFNGRNGMTLVATRRILVGEEITVSYATNYFGKKNKDCLCATCEKEGRGAFALQGNELDLNTEQEGSTEEEDSEDIIMIKDYPDSEEEKPNQGYPTPSDDSPEEVYELLLLGSDSEISSIPGFDVTKPSKSAAQTRASRLRPRNKIACASRLTIEQFPIDNSPDTLRMQLGSSKSLNTVEISQRKMFRTLQRLYNTRFFTPQFQRDHPVFDCYNCGCYFEFDKQSFERQNYGLKPLKCAAHGSINDINKLYCPRCLRHYKIYKLAWPLTKYDASLISHLECTRQFLTFWPCSRLPISPVKGPNPYRKYNPETGALEVQEADPLFVSHREHKLRAINMPEVDLGLSALEKLGDIDYILSDIRDLKLALRTGNGVRTGADVPLRLQLIRVPLEPLRDEWVRLWGAYRRVVQPRGRNAQIGVYDDKKKASKKESEKGLRASSVSLDRYLDWSWSDTEDTFTDSKEGDTVLEKMREHFATRASPKFYLPEKEGFYELDKLNRHKRKIEETEPGQRKSSKRNVKSDFDGMKKLDPLKEGLPQGAEVFLLD